MGRERKVSWNDSGIARDLGSDRRRKSSTTEHVAPTGPGTLLSSKIKGSGSKSRTTSVDEETFQLDIKGETHFSSENVIEVANGDQAGRYGRSPTPSAESKTTTA